MLGAHDSFLGIFFFFLASIYNKAPMTFKSTYFEYNFYDSFFLLSVLNNKTNKKITLLFAIDLWINFQIIFESQS